MKRNQVEKKECVKEEEEEQVISFSYLITFYIYLIICPPFTYFLAFTFPIAQLQQFKFLFSLLLYLFRHCLANTSALVYFLLKELLLLFLERKQKIMILVVLC